MNSIVYGQTIEEDTKTISRVQYDMMSTCPVLLDECRDLRQLDSLYIFELENEYYDMRNEKNKVAEQLEDSQNETKAEKKKHPKMVAIGVGVGVAVMQVLRLLLN